MSVYVTMRVTVDPAEFEKVAAEYSDVIDRIMAMARSKGIIAHRWFRGDGLVMSVDEWPDPHGFYEFYGLAAHEIVPFMNVCGVTGPPEVMVWGPVAIDDAFGWDEESPQGPSTSVYSTMRVSADPAAFEEAAAGHADTIGRIMEIAKGKGLIAHRWFRGDGVVAAVDEWPDEESFHAFMDAAGAEIGPFMEAAGVTEPPEVTFWGRVAIHDTYGWGA